MLSKILFLICIATIAGSAQMKDSVIGWKGLKPGVSSRHDVEKLLGDPKTPGSNIYDVGTEVIAVWYSPGTCKETPDSNWDLEKDVITWMTVSPRQPLEFSKALPFLGTGYERTKDIHIQNEFHYENADHSVTVATRIRSDGSEQIDYFMFLGSANYAKKCKR
jgi:hypothetical protein